MKNLIKISIFILVFIVFLMIGFIPVVPCRINCNNRHDWGALQSAVDSLQQKTEFCSLNTLNEPVIIASKYGCDIKPSIMDNNIILMIFFIIILPIIVSVFAVRIVNKRVFKKY